MVEMNFFKPLTESQAFLLLSRLNNFLAEQGVQSYLVGGFVRDVMLGRDTADIDIAVAADALEISPRVADAFGGKYVLLDKINRVGRVVLTDKDRWEIDFSTIENSIEQDLGRRDFTIDAMAVDLGYLGENCADVLLIDPFHGEVDLRSGVLRAVAENTFESDAARLLRAVRLAAELGFTIDEETEALIQRYSHLISSVAGERAREELLRLLAVPQAGQLLLYLDKLGLLTSLIPEMAQMKGVSQPKEHFWDVFDHSVRVVVAVDFLLRQGKWEYADEEVLTYALWSEMLTQYFDQTVSSGSTRRTLLKLAALLHDTAKPQTKAIDAGGRMRFLGHANEGAIIASGILERLRFSAKEIRLVETMVKHHLRPVQMSHGELPSHRAIYRYFRDTDDASIDTLFLSLADHLATRGPKLIPAHWRGHTRIVEYVLDQRFNKETLVVPPKLVDGHDLISVFGMRPGPRIGELLEIVREAQASGELTTREEILSFIRDHLLSKAV